MTQLEKLNQSIPLAGQRHRRNRFRSQLNRQSHENNNKTDKSATQSQIGAYQKLPILRVKKILNKIGAGDNKKQLFIPNQEDQSSFRKSKWEQLKRQYSPERYVKKQPFDGELDEVVLDCWNYGDNNGKKTVWRRYRQNYDDLTFDTLKIMRKK